MKIDNNLRIGSGTNVSDVQPRTTRGAGGRSGSATGGSSVELSPLAAQLQKIEASLADVPVVDASRVEEIKQAISDGRFQVNPGLIADRLLDSVRELIQAHKG